MSRAFIAPDLGLFVPLAKYVSGRIIFCMSIAPNHGDQEDSRPYPNILSIVGVVFYFEVNNQLHRRILPNIAYGGILTLSYWSILHGGGVNFIIWIDFKKFPYANLLWLFYLNVVIGWISRYSLHKFILLFGDFIKFRLDTRSFIIHDNRFDFIVRNFQG